MTLAVCGAFYNPRKATCGEVWTDCYAYEDPEALANPFSVAVKGTVQLQAQATYADGSVDDFTSSSSWSSNNTAVATVGASTGLVTGVSPGSAEIYFQFPSLVMYSGELCTGGAPIPCPIAAPIVESSGSVMDFTIVPGSFQALCDGQKEVVVYVSSFNCEPSGSCSAVAPPESYCSATVTSCLLTREGV
jgi:hypothetical protein